MPTVSGSLFSELPSTLLEKSEGGGGEIEKVVCDFSIEGRLVKREFYTPINSFTPQKGYLKKGKIGDVDVYIDEGIYSEDYKWEIFYKKSSTFCFGCDNNKLYDDCNEKYYCPKCDSNFISKKKESLIRLKRKVFNWLDTT